MRVCGFAVCGFAIVVAAQWLSLSFGWDSLFSADTVRRRTDDIAGTIREGPAMLVAVGVGIVGLVASIGWLLSFRHSSRDTTFKFGSRSDQVRIDRETLAASLERNLEPLDQRVDVSVSVSRRGRVDLRLVTPDVSATGPAAEHVSVLTDSLGERGLPMRIGRVDVVDVRRLKSRHRVR